MTAQWISIIRLIIIVCLSINCDGICLNCDNKSELLSVFAVFRHGDRSPLLSYPNDPYFDKKFWPAGFGQLTSRGIKRAHFMGKWLRRHYGSWFLNDTYHRDDVYFYSSDLDRTLMTAQAVLNGLYPPKGEQIWSEEILWQPIPVHTSQRVKDDLILDKRNCTKFTKILSHTKKFVYAEAESMYQNFFAYVKKFSGYSKVTPKEIEDMKVLLYVYENRNESFIPVWLKRIKYDPNFRYLANLKMQLPTSTRLLARLKQGPFFHKMLCLFDDLSNNGKSSSTPKFYGVSCHDSCLISALDAMGIYDFRDIAFTDTLLWEFRKSKNSGEYFINILYRHYDDRVEKMKLGTCDFDCNYEKFKKLMGDVPVSIKKWEKECEEDLSTIELSKLSYPHLLDKIGIDLSLL